MNSFIFTFIEYLKYKIRAVNSHSLHSPFLFEFYNQVIVAKHNKYAKQIDEIRNAVFRLDDQTEFTDPKTSIKRTVNTGKWAKHVTSSKKFSSFLIRLINHLDAQTVLETGTATGINASSLSLSNAKEIVSIEGSEEILKIAKQTIAHHGNNKVKLILGEIRSTFESALKDYNPDVIFLDADHRSETISFYLSAINEMNPLPKCILIHDIYWSKDMNNAWRKVVNNNHFNLTIDLFEVGLIFPDYPAQKQHFTIQF